MPGTSQEEEGLSYQEEEVEGEDCPASGAHAALPPLPCPTQLWGGRQSQSGGCSQSKSFLLGGSQAGCMSKGTTC